MVTSIAEKTLETCPGCGFQSAAVDGATDRYGGASPSCWALFAEVCAKDYGEFRYPEVHRLIVDAYMAQHPGFSTAAGRRSVAVHLVGLFCALEEQLGSTETTRAMTRAFPEKADLPPFIPIPWLGEMNITSVHGATSLEEHIEQAKRWARAVWDAWSPHHPRVRRIRFGEK